jgi:CHAD domain-containing protein
MTLEREVKLNVHGDFAFPGFLDVGADLSVTPIERLTLETTYYDTPDLRLTRWGYSLRYRKGEAWTLKRPASNDGTVLARDELTFAGPAKVPPAEAQRLLRAFVRREALAPVAQLATVRQRVRLQTSSGSLAAEVVDDDVTVPESGTRFRQVEVELGPAADEHLLTRVLKRLRAAGATSANPTPKLHLALGPRAAAAPEVASGELGKKPLAGDVVRHALASSVASLFQHDAGTRLGDDPEDLHQARVAVRRLRSDLRTFSSLLETEWRDSLRGELRWLGAELGSVRDADVLVNRLQTQAGNLPREDLAAASELIDLARAQGALAQKHLLEALDSERYLDLLERLVQAANAPALLPEAENRAVGMVPNLVARPWRRLRRAVLALPVDPADEELHRVRILAKRCRYAAEAVSPVIGKRAARFARAAAAMQGVLGDHHDSVRAQAWLREPDKPAELLLAAGELLAMERDAATALAIGWWKDWRTLDRKISRSWLA